jgi:hypothetical protein
MKIAGYGIQIDLPRGWEGKIYRRPEGDPTVHAGNFPLPAQDGDFGSAAVSGMPANGLFIALTEYRHEDAARQLFAATGLPLPIAPSDLDSHALQRTLPGQSGVQRFFTQSGRPFCLYLVVGSSPTRDKLVEEANRVLRTLSIGRNTQPYAYAPG